MSYLLLFLAGLVGANAVPHFVKGVIGEKHQSPFGKPSSAVTNVLWGVANGVGAVLLAREGLQDEPDFWPALLTTTAGVLVTGVGLALMWAKDDRARGR